MTDFTKAVVKTIRSIPKGKIASYSQVAELSGKPGASRGVAWILNSSSEEYGLPWHRVLRASGVIAFRRGSKEFNSQKRLLEKEKIEVAKDGSIDLAKYGWTKKPAKKRALKSTPKMFSKS